MTGAGIGEYLETVRERYARARKKEKGRILDELVDVAGCLRKAAVRVLRRRKAGSRAGRTPRPGPSAVGAIGKPASRAGRMPRPGPSAVGAIGKPASRARGGRLRAYDEDVVEVLRMVWEATDYLCSRRLQPFLPELVPVLQRCGNLPFSAEVATRVCRMSPSTIDRLLRPWRRSAARNRFSVTRPATVFKEVFPVTTFAPWDEARPGFLDVDLVHHGGASDGGSYLITLIGVDEATGWSECVAVWSKGQERICEAIDRLCERLPVPLLGLDCDFISRSLRAYCQNHHISLARYKPHRERLSDVWRVDPKKWSIARRLIGYDRYSSMTAFDAMDQVYGVLRLYVNFFQPTMKLAGKTWHRSGARQASDGQACEGRACDDQGCDDQACDDQGCDGQARDGKARDGKLHARKVYAPAQTPYRRLLASGLLSDDAHARGRRELEAICEGLNPMLLRQQLDDSLKCLRGLADSPGTQSWTTGKSRFSNTGR